MPIANVDLSALLPALKEAAQPFRDAMPRGAISISDATTLRAYAPVGNLHLGELRRLLEAVEAVRRVAGDEQ